MTVPSVANREPWQGQSHVTSVGLNSTVQPRCVQTAETAWTSPAGLRYTAVLAPLTSTTVPSPGATPAGTARAAGAPSAGAPSAGAPSAGAPSAGASSGGSGTSRGAPPLRLLSNTAAHGLAVPHRVSRRIKAAAVPLVRPHLRSPVITWTCRDSGPIRPT